MTGAPGLLVVAGTFVYLLIVSKMEKKSRVSAPKRQESEAKLVAAVLEQVQGMSVIKSFNLVGRGDRRIQEALEYNRSSNLELEQLFTPYTIAEGLVIQLFSVLMIGGGCGILSEWDAVYDRCADVYDPVVCDLCADPDGGQQSVCPASGQQFHRAGEPDG